jgi:hypothetical protein
LVPDALQTYPEDNHRLGSVECEADVFINAALWFRDHVSHIPSDN